MTTTSRLPIVPIGMSLSALFVATYLLCVLYGLLWPALAMHELLSMLFPGFTWITWWSFVIGLVWSLAYAWYIALVFAPAYNFFAARQKYFRG